MAGGGDDRRSRRRVAPGPIGLGLVMGLVVGLAACAGLETVSPNTSSLPNVDEGLAIEVARVIDGDSLEVLIDGEVIEVRLLGINAPERFSLAGKETCAGQQARGMLESLLEAGDELRLSGDETDRFGRLLADIDIGTDGAWQSVADAMVGSGWALALWSGEDPGLIDAMREAATARLGWWGSVCGTVDAALEVTGDQVDAPGDDRENLTEEWIEITNVGVEPVDLAGWTVRDETTSNRFLIDDLIDDLTMQPGAVVRFLTGAGPSSASEVFLGESYPVWSNRGETVLLVDPDGVIATNAFIEG